MVLVSALIILRCISKLCKVTGHNVFISGVRF